MKESFLLFKSFYEPTRHLSLTDKGKLYDAIFLYQLDGTEPDAKSPVYPFFLFFKNQFRLDEKKYSEIAERNRQNGKFGGRPTKTSKTQNNPRNPVGFSKPRKADNENDNVNENENVNEKVFAKRSYLANVPADDIDEFCQKFNLSSDAVMAKAEDLFNWVQAKDKRYANYKAFLRNALSRDADKLRVQFPVSGPDDPQTEAAWAALHAETDLERLLGKGAHGR